MTQAFPGYPPQAPQYPPAAPQQPAYPAAPAYPQPQQFAPQYPVQQGYPAPMMAPPPPALATGTIDDFFSQPSAGGGKALSFHQKPYGTTYVGIVTRPLGNGDIQQQTDTQQRPQFFKDGRPKFVMKVPLQLQPSPEFPDGLATWFVKGQARDELARAMSETGAPAGPPEAGSIIQITYTGERQAVVGMNPAKQFAVVYTRPDGTSSSPAPAVAQQPAPQQFQQPVAQQMQVPPVYGQVPQQPVPQAPAVPQPAPPVMQPATPAQPPAAPQVPAQAAAPQPPADMSAEQAALLARLTGGQPQQPQG
jgi:hypothetical protein